MKAEVSAPLAAESSSRSGGPLKVEPPEEKENIKVARGGPSSAASASGARPSSPSSACAVEACEAASKSKGAGDESKGEGAAEAEKPNFEPSGLLAAETNMINGIVVKYSLPPDSRMPMDRWRLYVFKRDPGVDQATQEPTSILHVHRQERYIFGKEIRVVDVPLRHPTISKQHAVLQYRKRNDAVIPYIIDLESTNGTYLNGSKVEPARYYELRAGDIMRFGKSTREFVIIHTGSVEAPQISISDYLEEKERAKA
eukprot:GHVT01028038.1.p1 GENE.GHVT01028038.1~~GHVT01028038.1.p1  ORF type:complete len:256 (+),score=59.58 GHVT01028038.1:1167-1934(+)